jgi:hypothetical protein
MCDPTCGLQDMVLGHVLVGQFVITLLVSGFYYCQPFENASELVLSNRFAMEDNKDVVMIYSSCNLLDNCKRLILAELRGDYNWL